MSRIPDGASPDIKNKSWSITADAEVKSDTTGMIITQGGLFGGWALYLERGRPVFHYNFVDVDHYQVAGKDAIAAGKHVIRMDFAYDGGGIGKGGTATISVDGNAVAKGRIEKTIPIRVALDETLDVGEDADIQWCHVRDGSAFGTDLQVETRMLRDHLDDALGELVSRGLITADGFSGLRGLVAEKPTTSRRSNRGRAERIRVVRPAIGRWSVTRQSTTSDETCDSANLTHDVHIEWAWQFLRRWGIVFRDLLSNEDGAPVWFELLQVFRKLEARGEIRGGRFITGVAGEQFALADTVQKMRQLRDEGPRDELILITAADPLNLVGVLSKHDRVPRIASNRVAYLDGLPIAVLRGGNAEILETAREEHLTTALNRLRQFSLLPTETNSVLTATAEV